MTEYTKKQRFIARLTGIISLLLNILPVIIFVIAGFIKGEPGQKLTLGFTAIIALVFGIINLLFKANLKRTIFWIVMIGIYVCLDKMASIIITMAICTIIDELIMSPIHKHYTTKYKTNKEIDKRL